MKDDDTKYVVKDDIINTYNILISGYNYFIMCYKQVITFITIMKY